MSRNYDRDRYRRRYDEDERDYDRDYNRDYERGRSGRGSYSGRSSYSRDFSGESDYRRYAQGSRSGMDYDREFGTTGTPGYSSRRGYGIDRDYDDYGFQTDYGYMRDPNRDREYYDRDEERNRGRAGEGYYRRTARGYGYEGDRDTDYERGQRGREDRGWLGRMTDEVRSWFGDEDFERERRRDERRGGMYRGRGPRGYRRSDDRIKEDINDRLTDHPYLDASDIEVIVAAGEVTLTGLVDSRNAKRMAEEIAEDVSGVANVENRLKVRQDRWETSRRDALTDTGTTQTNTGSEAAATTSTGSSGRRSS